MTKDDRVEQVDRDATGNSFQREKRFIVIKIRDLSDSDGAALARLIDRRNIRTRKAVVVEADWPEYETVWKMIEDRCTGAASLSRPAQSAELLEAAKNVASYADFRQRRGRLPDLIEEAIGIYDDFMKDDSYDAWGCVRLIVAKLESARDFYDYPRTAITKAQEQGS